MVFLLSVFMLALLVIGLYAGISGKDYRGFVIAGHNQSFPVILLSLLATMIGGSATFGIASTGYSLGFPAIWWLGVGSVGLLFQAAFVAGKIRDLQVHTLSEAGEKLVGRSAGKVISIIIVLSWIGIIGGQFAALSQLASLIFGNVDSRVPLAAVALTVILFTALGGQLAVMRTDCVFFFIIFAGILSAFPTLYTNGDIIPKILDEITLFHHNFTPFDLIYLLLIVGGTYFIGPDILSRSMTAKNAKCAKQASVAAAGILLLINLLIVGIALWCKISIPDLHGMNPFIYLISDILPSYIGILLALGLSAALLSSASTCLITVAATIQNDLICKKSIWGTRCLIVLIGSFAAIIAFRDSDVISILTAAYTIYAPGIVLPLFVAIWAYPKIKVRNFPWMCGVILGCICGLAGNILQSQILPLLGMAISGAFALCSLKAKRSKS